ncbi:MAG: protein of unknown function (DUF3576) [Pelagibacterales bacterium]|nr:protein of unknown function (DUF3576) [Pelagibacterales bacterium]
MFKNKANFSNELKKKLTLLLVVFLSLTLFSCGLYRKQDDYTKVPVSADDKVKKNMEEGRGFSISKLAKKNRGGSFEFTTSNAMWRASLDILDFVPLTNADYGGGIIITDWYNDSKKTNEYIKISLQFLSNEIRSDALKVIIHKKVCDSNNSCNVKKINSKLNNEVKLAILKKASLFKNRDLKKIRNAEGPIVLPKKKN